MKANPFEKYLGPEDHVHIQVCEYVKWKYRGAVVHHSPNAGKRTPFERWKLERLSVSAGFPDLIIFYPQASVKTIALELKAGKGKATAYQLAWVEHLNAAGIPAKVCTGYEEAIRFIDQQFNPLKAA